MADRRDLEDLKRRLKIDEQATEPNFADSNTTASTPLDWEGADPRVGPTLTAILSDRRFSELKQSSHGSYHLWFDGVDFKCWTLSSLVDAVRAYLASDRRGPGRADSSSKRGGAR